MYPFLRERGLSQPELATIVELADFFDTSVDVLVGYEMKDNRPQAAAERLERCRREKDRAGLAEAEKALGKYPNDFKIVYRSAALYLVFGIEEKDAALLRRAIVLLGAAVPLLPQNDDPRISESTLSGEMAEALLGLGMAEKAVERLKKNNAGGRYDALIGMTLAADCGRADEAARYLSDGLVRSVIMQIHVVMGYLNVYLARRDFQSAAALLRWGVGSFSGLRRPGRMSFLDKIESALLAHLAFAQFSGGDRDGARRTLAQAAALAASFDSAPDYSVAALRFTDGSGEAGAYDDLGSTAMDGVRRAVAAMESAEFSALWAEIDGEEESDGPV